MSGERRADGKLGRETRGPAVPPHVAAIAPYVPGKPIEELERELGITETAKLASNENPFGASPLALEAARRALAEVNRYPDGSAFRLRRAIAELHGVTPDCVVVGGGTTDIMEITARTFLSDGEPAVFGDQAFVMFALFVQGVNGRGVVVPMPGHRHDLPAMAEAARRDSAKLVYLPNPNNPTGTYVCRAELDAYFELVPEQTLTILDEAYFEYVDRPDYPDGLVDFAAGRNVLVLRTFSKIYGLAGLRIGYGIAPAPHVGEMNKIRSPFNTSLVAQEAAIAALGDREHRELSRRRNLEEMAFLSAGLSARGIRFEPSVTNFFLVHSERPAAEVYDSLLRRGVIVRPVGVYGLKKSFRLSIGTRSENERFLEAWDAVAAEAK